MKKDFIVELYSMINLLKVKENFAFVRFGDGEATIIFNKSYDNTNKFNGEWAYDNTNQQHKLIRERLINSLTYASPNYFIGLPAHMDNNSFMKLKGMTSQDEKYLTFASLFIDGNYFLFKNEMYPLFKTFNIITVFHKKAKFDNINFKIDRNFAVGVNAWINDINVIDDIKKYIIENNVKNTLFLVAAGPLSNILIHELYIFEKDNIYLDIGSVLDDIVGLGQTRHFLRGHECLTHIHKWR